MTESPSKREIFPKIGQEHTVFVTTVPTVLKGMFLKETKLESDTVDVWVIGSNDLDRDLREAIDGKMDDGMNVGKANLFFIPKDEFQQKLASYEIEKLGIQPSLQSKMTFERITALEAVKIDVAATTMEIINDVIVLKDNAKLPASYVLDFHISTLNHGLKTTIRTSSQTFGPIIGKTKTVLNLKQRMIDADIFNERRMEKKPSNKPSKQLITIFV